MLRDLLPVPDAASEVDAFMNVSGAEEEHLTGSADPLDDVFGSTPASPVLPPHGEAQDEDRAERPPALDPSDIPRLRSIHVTNGYREGIAASKEKYIQEGFDEGYALGAELGMKAGWCLGALDGLLRAFPTRGDAEAHDDDARMRGGREEIANCMREAEEDLQAERLFDQKYFGADGIWLYDVLAVEGDEEVTFSQVAQEHPLVKKWTDHVKALSGKLGLSLP